MGSAGTALRRLVRTFVDQEHHDVVILLDDGTIVCDKNFFATNDSTNGGSRWQFYVANRSANHFGCGFVTVRYGFDSFRRTATQRRYVYDVCTANVRQQGGNGCLLW